MVATVLFFVASFFQQVSGQLEEECLLLGCCDEDCCALGTYWEPDVGRCFAVEAAPGFEKYDPDHQFGCAARECCEDDCCWDGTVYDESVKCCVPIMNATNAPTPSPTLDLSSSPTAAAAICKRDWTGKIEQNVNFGSKEAIDGIKKAFDSSIDNAIAVINKWKDFQKYLIDFPGLILKTIRELVKAKLLAKLPDWYGKLRSWLRIPPRERPVLPDAVKRGIKELEASLKDALEKLKAKLEALKVKFIEEIKKKFDAEVKKYLPNKKYPFKGVARQTDKKLFGPLVTANTEEFGNQFNFKLEYQDLGFEADVTLKYSMTVDGDPAVNFDPPGGVAFISTTCEAQGPETVADRVKFSISATFLATIVAMTISLSGKGRDSGPYVQVPIKPV